MSFNTPPPPPPPSGPPPPPPGGTPPPPPGGYQVGGYPAGGWQPVGPKPPSYLVWAILTTLFCCLPFGIVSIVFAAQVDSKYNAGDLVGSMESSKNAKKWAIVAAVVPVALIVVWFLLAVVLTTASRSTN